MAYSFRRNPTMASSVRSGGDSNFTTRYAGGDKNDHTIKDAGPDPLRRISNVVLCSQTRAGADTAENNRFCRDINSWDENEQPEIFFYIRLQPLETP